MNNKLTQEQIDGRLRAYERAIAYVTVLVMKTGGVDEQGAAAVVKELRGNRNRFIKRMEAGKVGRKRTLNR